MALRVTFKSLVVLAATTSFCLVIFNVSSTSHPASRPHTRIAHITAKDLLAIRQIPDVERVIPQPMNTVHVLNTSPHALLSASQAVPSPCGNDCQSPQNKSKEAGTQLYASLKAQQQKQQQQNNIAKQPCGRTCRLNKLWKKGQTKPHSYVSKVQVENVTLPGSWTVTRELVDRLSQRQKHVQDTCRKYGLDKANKTYQPNAWEFLINEEHNLVWCNVFKAASSTWLYNFNLLAGYSEFELLHSKESPVTLARKHYKRPRVEELMAFLNSSRSPLSFMIARHPLERLVSGYRDKILSGNRYYSKLSRTIAKTYHDLALKPVNEKEWRWPRPGRPSGSMVVATFPQFVQFLLDETAKGHKLDEHWIPASTFCTPCLVSFDVFAKVETLQEDGNYIIFSSGINDIIKPKMINRSRDAPTKDVTNKFLCQLTKDQMEGLIQMYKLDLELFQYDISNYRDCARESPKTHPT